MSLTQKAILALVSPATAAAMERESRDWLLHCDCGHERSVWDVGGIRYMAAGNPRRLLRCPVCNRSTWHLLYRRETGFESLVMEPEPGFWSEFREFLVQSPAWWLAPIVLLFALLGMALTLLPAEAVPFIYTLW